MKEQSKRDQSIRKRLTAAGTGVLLGLSLCMPVQAEEGQAAQEEGKILFEAICQEKLEEYLVEHPEGTEED